MVLPSIDILGAPVDMGQDILGSAEGPEYFRSQGLQSFIENLGFSCEDLGDVESQNNIYKELYSSNLKHIKKNQVLINLGGDHSLSLATVAALSQKYPQLLVLWVDAHGDINTPQTSPTGHLHGMPLAALLNLFELKKEKSIFSWYESPYVKSSQVALIGPRDLDEGEKQFIKEYSIFMKTTKEIKEEGMEKIFSEIQNRWPHSPIHISFDVDILDPKHAPSTGTPVGKGISLEDLCFMAEKLGETKNVVSMDWAELNCKIGSSESVSKTKDCFFLFLESFLRGLKKAS